jgi:hypothetical protein
MAKRKRTIGQTTIYKTLHGKLMIEQPESGVNSGAQEWQQFLLHLLHHRVTVKRHHLIWKSRNRHLLRAIIATPLVIKT